MVVLKLPKEQKDRIVANVQEYFQQERSEEIGNLAAEALLDFMLGELGPVLYNQAIADARKLVRERMLSIEDDLYALERRSGRK